ncbi:OmpA family protein [Vicingus serpentipes]|uniref:OmpA family protein n=1 Tax=Vicingus serpentipes TaxID=1926625 RepID=A0A5C6RQE7_9FLAO|nr:OmpA family protein [Vicingus serpentipes]TXB64561.1 OmpA family protein [Vicingus serpentipes]
MRHSFFIIILLSLIQYSFAQESDPYTKRIECDIILKATDIENAIKVGKVNKLFLKCSPKGSGNQIEVASGRSKDKFYFEKEHNVVWIKFTIPKTGDMVFSIKPKNPENDYDFLLFKSEGENNIQKIKSKKLKPIRSNLSRFNIEKRGITGLNFDANQTHVIAGIQSEFSSPVKAVKDEEYYLVLDNVYDEGQGVIVEFGYYDTKKISGYVTNESSDKKIAAEVSWDDAETGKTLATTKADAKTGYFEMEVPFVITNPEKMYILAIDAEEYFFEEKMISVEKLKALSPKPLNFALPELKKGKRLQVNNIHFEGGQPVFISSAYPSLKRLVKLMKKNKTLKILVEGHTNGCDARTNSQLLSERRALRVKKYLFDNKIDDIRIEAIGKGCSEMLYPITGTQEQQQLNRRVEILVLEY